MYPPARVGEMVLVSADPAVSGLAVPQEFPAVLFFFWGEGVERGGLVEDQQEWEKEETFCLGRHGKRLSGGR